MAVVTQKLTTEKFITQKLTKEEILHCPRCGEVMLQDCRGFCWQCPKCSGEWWDDESKLRLLRSQAAARAAEETLCRQLRWSLSKRCDIVMPLVPVIDPRSRGSRSSRRKKPLPRPLMTERHLLF